MRASLLAMATTTTFSGAQASSASNQAPIGVRSRLIRNTAARAPWMRILRRYTLPRLLMPSNLALPPVEYCRGTTPSHAAKIASLPKGCAVADGGNDGRGHDRPDPWNLPDASTTRIGGGDPATVPEASSPPGGRRTRLSDRRSER